MLRNFLRSKIHRATVTEANVDYVGSLAIDEELMELAGIEENEIVHLANLSNGERLTTYAIKSSERWSHDLHDHGAAALKMSVGDQIIIFAFGWYNEQESKEHHPHLVFVDVKNNPILNATSEAHAQTV